MTVKNQTSGVTPEEGTKPRDAATGTGATTDPLSDSTPNPLVDDASDDTEEDGDLELDTTKPLQDQISLLAATLNKVKEERREARQKAREARAEAEAAKSKVREFEQANMTEQQRKDARLAELEGTLGTLTSERDRFKTEVATMSTALMGSLDAEIAKWPDKLKAKDPGKDKPAERVKWADEMRDIAAELMKTVPARGNDVSPLPREKPEALDPDKDGKDQHRATRSRW